MTIEVIDFLWNKKNRVNIIEKIRTGDAGVYRLSDGNWNLQRGE